MTHPDSPRIFTPPPLLYLAGLVLGLAIDGRLSWGVPPASLISRAIALGLASIGLVLIVSGLAWFRRMGARPEPWSPATILVTSGIYRLTRNPMYLGLTLLHAGLALLFRSPAAGAILVPLVLVMNFAIIPREEAYLTRRFGDSYSAYRARVRRWL
jgi:protein-S-isoprenylcysteine O-methyltransferase Ste14